MGGKSCSVPGTQQSLGEARKATSPQKEMGKRKQMWTAGQTWASASCSWGSAHSRKQLWHCHGSARHLGCDPCQWEANTHLPIHRVKKSWLKVSWTFVTVFLLRHRTGCKGDTFCNLPHVLDILLKFLPTITAPLPLPLLDKSPYNIVPPYNKWITNMLGKNKWDKNSVFQKTQPLKPRALVRRAKQCTGRSASKRDKSWLKSAWEHPELILLLKRVDTRQINHAS